MGSASSATLELRQRNEPSPALRALMGLFIPAGSRCLNLRLEDGGAIRSWLADHGCSYVEANASQGCALPFPDESFDAALLIGVLDDPLPPQLAMPELRRVLRPGGALLVVAPNACYWRRRVDRMLAGGDSQIGSLRPRSLRGLLVKAGFGLVGVEGHDGGILRELPLTRRLGKRQGSAPYRVAERLVPSLLGAQVAAFAIRV